ncbi:Bug family tripartite tricarboxylate transporter substrate binding protein [Bordetella petrii]|uniref:Bug family tripartite tricarboxylate transporter substrate binding protein n=1 Tax=Bordetella petrii TaxID=94624 RepID=UPI001E370EB6|nr:tripartite tricarboxylate transporter substrate binding protein [Bordetella petrii]MCD0504470.1 tripartite tricarboxylate transporter substrate binding protein [Bordetella petrii]
MYDTKKGFVIQSLRGLAAAASAACVAAALLVPAGGARAAYPERPVTLIVPFAAGGASDITARLVARELGSALNQSFVVENKPGASTQIATRQVINSTPDGYTLLLATTSVINNAYLYKNLNYDAAKSLRPVISIVDVPAFLTVGPAMDVKSVPDFLAKARAASASNTLNFGSAGTASTLHLAGEWFNQAAHLKGIHIPFKGSGPAMVALAGGEVGYSFENYGPALPQVDAGRAHILAIAGPKRFPGLPDVPTLREAAGLPDTNMASWFVLMAPAATPDANVDLLNKAVNTILAKPEVQQQLLGLGLVPTGGTPQYLADRMKEDSKKWIDIIQAGNVTIENQ